MKLFLDLKNRRFVKSAASNVALDRLVLKRRDTLPIEILYVENGATATPPAGTTAAVGLKAKFSDSNFLAFAAPGQTILDLNTIPVEAAFSSNPATISALLEIKWGAPGTALRTATLQVELQNSVITGDEGTPAAIPDGKSTQAEATAGTDNDKWMTPLRTAQAIAELAPPPTWDSVTGKPATFPATAHTHLKSEITGLDADLAALSAADAALDARIDHLTANLDPAALDSISEAVEVINTERTERIAADAALQTAVDGKATAAQGAKADTALQPEPVDYQGVYNNGADYFPGQVVSYNGELYIRIGEPNPGYPPPGSYWAAFDPSASPAFKLWVELSKADTIHTHTAADISDFASAVETFTPALPPISFQTTRYDGDGTTAAFAPPGTLTESDSPSAVFVTINGVTQEPGSDYILNISTNRVVLSDPLSSGDKIVITRPILLPSNTTLSAEQIGALTNTSVIDGGSF